MNEPREQPTTTNGTPRARNLQGGETRSFLMTFLELVCSRWLLIGAIFFSATFWSFVTVVRAPDTYEALCQVMIRRGKIQAVRNEPILRQQEDVGSELDLLLSISVLEETVRQLIEQAEGSHLTDTDARPLIYNRPAARRPEVALQLDDLPTTDPAQFVKYLKKRVHAGKFGESNVIDVGLVSVNPRFAAAAVNTLVDVYEAYHLTMDDSPGQADFFELELENIDREINALQLRLAQFMGERGIADPVREVELLELRRHALTGELDKLQGDKAALEADLESASEEGRHPPFIRQDMSIQQLRQLLFVKEAQLAEIRSQVQAGHPSLVAKREEVEDLRQRLAAEEELAVRQQQHLHRQILEREKELTQKITGIDAKISEYPMLQAEIDKLDRDIKQRTIKRVDLVEQMFKSTTFERTDQSLSKVRVLGYSQVPTLPRQARKGFKFAVAVLLSLMAAVVVAIFVEGLDHSIRRREEIEEQLNVPYLASISTHSR